jgi:hypothetical protein
MRRTSHRPDLRKGLASGVSFDRVEIHQLKITVFIDAQHAVGTDGEAGVVLEAGPRIGPDTLGAILCDGITEITVNAEDGIPISYGRHTRTIPPALRRAIIHRDANRCAADGCDSRNRLQVHHITPWSEGGPTDPDNLITLCWYHHHIVIHQQHSTLYLPSRTRPHPIQTTRTGATRRRLTHRNRTPVLVVQAP